jgi:glutamate racemase
VSCIRRDVPEATLYYCCDNLNFPYGTKNESDVVAFTTATSLNFVRRYQLDLLVIACNTASTVALNSVRAALAIPVVGVVPAIKPAAKQSRTRAIALLATPATVRRPYTHKLIEDFADGCTVTMHGSSLLVELAERKLRGEELTQTEIAAEMAPLFGSAGGDAIDTVVLGCTHFPLLRPELESMRPDITWIDSGPAIAARVRSLVGEPAVPTPTRRGQGAVLFTADTPAARALGTTMMTYGFAPLDFP